MIRSNDSDPWNRWLSRALLVLAILILAALSIGPAIASPLAIDEQVTYYLACGHHPDTVFARCVEQSATPPLYFWISRTCLHLGGQLTPDRLREFWLRLPSLLCGFLALITTYIFVERWICETAGGVATLLLVVQRDLGIQATQARPYTMGLFLSLLVAYSLLDYRQTNRKQSLLGLFLSCSALLWTHFLFAAALPAVWIGGCLAGNNQLSQQVSQAPRQPTFWKLTFAMMLSSITLLPLLPGLLRMWGTRETLNWYTENRKWFDVFAMFDLRSLEIAGGIAVLFWIARRAKIEPDLSFRKMIGLAIWFVVPGAVLWIASQNYGSSLAQPRYLITQLGPAAVLTGHILISFAGQRGAAVAVLVLLFCTGTFQLAFAKLQQPVQHDSFWLNAAKLLDEKAGAEDLVLTQSGLVETYQLPGRFDDIGYQEYCCSRLSDFYLKKNLRRLTLPRVWIDGEWCREYEKSITALRERHSAVWLVISADTDLGKNLEAATIAWLKSLGMQIEIAEQHAVWRTLRATFPN